MLWHRKALSFLMFPIIHLTTLNNLCKFYSIFVTAVARRDVSSFSHQGPDFRRVVMLRNGAVRTKQNLSTAHEFVVC